MTETEIKNLIESTQIDTYRSVAPVGTKTPYIVFDIRYPNNYGADNVVYYKVPTVELQLYESKPDPSNWEAIEQTLTDAGIYWTSDSADDPAQSLFIKYYYFGG